MMQQNSIILTTSSELNLLIREAVANELLQIRLRQKDDPLPLPEYMGIEQASAYLNLATQTTYGYVSKRSIPFIKKGGKLLFKKSALEQWLDQDEKPTKKQMSNNFKNK